MNIPEKYKLHATTFTRMKPGENKLLQKYQILLFNADLSYSKNEVIDRHCHFVWRVGVSIHLLKYSNFIILCSVTDVINLAPGAKVDKCASDPTLSWCRPIPLQITEHPSGYWYQCPSQPGTSADRPSSRTSATACADVKRRLIE